MTVSNELMLVGGGVGVCCGFHRQSAARRISSKVNGKVCARAVQPQVDQDSLLPRLQGVRFEPRPERLVEDASDDACSLQHFFLLMKHTHEQRGEQGQKKTLRGTAVLIDRAKKQKYILTYSYAIDSKLERIK